MPFTPIPLLIIYDDAKSYCSRVLSGMVPLLESRGFEVSTQKVKDGPVDVAPYKGLIIGSPVFGLGLRGVAPTPALFDYVQRLEDFDRHQVAVYCVYQLHPGTSLDRMKGMVIEKGGRIVAARGYPVFKMNPRDHVIATECMIRIR